MASQEAVEPVAVPVESMDPLASARQAFTSAFPGVLQDGVIDAERLSAALGLEVSGLAGGKERFGLQWAGKRDTVASLQVPSSAALVPLMDQSMSWDTAQNVFIEGDNLEALKLLQKAYNDQVKLIYIDPPYNTGTDFVYHDDFTDPVKRYLEVTGQIDSEGNRLSANTDVSGRKHSNWLNMMYPRLVLARNLLTDDGCIFLSIDDNEVAHLRLLLDEVFGPENFIAELIWKSKSGGANDSQYFAVDHEYILCYARSAQRFSLLPDLEAEVSTSYPYEDDLGEYGLERLDKQNLSYSAGMDYDLVGPDGRIYKLTHKDPKAPNATWRWAKATVQTRMDELVFMNGNVYTKNYKKEGAVPRSLLVDERFGRTRSGSTDLKDLLGAAYFDNPKPVRLIRHLIALTTSRQDLVLDFFAGSGTTGQAVWEQNTLDGGDRRFVLVNIAQPTEPESKAGKAGYEVVSDVLSARLARYLEITPAAAKSGLRQLRVSGSGFLNAAPASDGQLSFTRHTLGGDFDRDSLASEALLKHGVRLDIPWERVSIPGGEIVTAGDRAVVVTTAMTSAAVDAALATEAHTVIFLEDAFAGHDDLKAKAYFALVEAKRVMATM